MKFFGRDHLVKHFEEMKLDEHGICEPCRGVDVTVTECEGLLRLVKIGAAASLPIRPKVVFGIPKL